MNNVISLVKHIDNLPLEIQQNIIIKSYTISTDLSNHICSFKKYITYIKLLFWFHNYHVLQNDNYKYLNLLHIELLLYFQNISNESYYYASKYKIFRRNIYFKNKKDSQINDFIDIMLCSMDERIKKRAINLYFGLFTLNELTKFMITYKNKFQQKWNNFQKIIFRMKCNQLFTLP